MFQCIAPDSQKYCVSGAVIYEQSACDSKH